MKKSQFLDHQIFAKLKQAESIFSSLKKGRFKKYFYKNGKLAIEDVSDYIHMFYNRTRRHQHLGGVSPAEFEAAAKHG